MYLFPQCHTMYISCVCSMSISSIKKDVFILILMARFIYILQYHKINQGIALMRCQRTCVQAFVWIDHKNHLDFSLWLRFDWPNVYVVFNFYNLKREQISTYNLFILKRYLANFDWYKITNIDINALKHDRTVLCYNNMYFLYQKYCSFSYFHFDIIKGDSSSWFALTSFKSQYIYSEQMWINLN